MSEGNLGRLRARFGRALQAAGANGDSTRTFDGLVARYAQPHRHYHTLTHVDACLAWLDWFCASASRPAEVELALWFHDAVYDPEANDNEHKSAQLAIDELGSLGIAAEIGERIAGHIQATSQHTAAGSDSALVVDLDLTILGAAPREFASFEDAIRQEYSHVAEPLFRAARKAVLQNFLSRPKIYRDSAIGSELESRARANLKRRISETRFVMIQRPAGFSRCKKHETEKHGRIADV